MRRFHRAQSVRRLAVTATALTVAILAIVLLSASSSSSAAAQQPGSRYAVQERGVRFSFMVPKRATLGTWGGWERHRSASTDRSPGGPISLNRSIVGPQGAEAIIYWTSFPHGEYADPCARLLKPSSGRSAASLAATVSTAPGTRLVKGPSNVLLGGRPAKQVVLTVREDVGCDPGFFYEWRHTFGGAFWGTDAGDTIRVWIVEVDGTRLFIAAATKQGVRGLSKQGESSLKRQVEQIVESIRFE